MRTNSYRTQLGCVFTGILLSACAAIPEDSAIKGRGDPDVISGLHVIAPGKSIGETFEVRTRDGDQELSYQINALSEPKAKKYDAAAEAELAKMCGPTTHPNRIGVVAGVIVSAIAEYIVGQMSAAVQQELLDYSVAYEAKQEARFYDPASLSPAGFSPALSSTCIRFVRFDKKRMVIRMDAIVQMQVSSTGDSLQLRPLRMYFRRGSFLKNTEADDVSIGMALAIDATWFDQSQGRTATVFTAQVLDPEKFKSSSEGEYRYFSRKDGSFSSDWREHPTVPLPPISTGIRGRLITPNVTFRMAGAEAGPVSKDLEVLARFLKAKKDDLSKLLADAISKRL